MIRLQVTGAPFFELIPMAIISLSDFTIIGLTQQQDNLKPSSLPFSLETMTVFYDGHFLVIHLSLRDELDPLNVWTQTIQPTQEPPFRRPTSSLKNDAITVALYKHNPHSKLFSETDGYLVNDTCYLEISFSDPSMRKSSIQKVPFPPLL